MADSEYSSTNENSKDSQDEITREPRFQFSEDEEALVIRMFKLVGERWSLIAGRIPGRTADEIEGYWKDRQATAQPK